ncbi:transporter associated domain-containing protein [Verrucomicrobium sp. BvORR034]|uniref:transporter associated domain-containing protein n=1 Tax=Verrucomicrobium sp. BvORR034 TaxID=1396418 RepID=UPI000679876E|nr:transporter associated domain-containing protein [Verrucomicrobium sp. BvORR034]
MSLLVPVILSLAFVVLLYVAASFSALETALFVLRKKGPPAEGVPGVRGRAQHAPEIKDPLSALPEVLLLGSFCNLVLATIGLWLVLGPLRGLGGNPWISGLSLFGTGFVVVEFLPNALALRSPTRTLRRTLPLFLAVRGFCRPVTRYLRQFSEGLATFFAPKKVKPRHNLLPEEVETLIDMREEQGALGTDEAALLRAVIDLNGLTVRDAMTPRVDLLLMPHDAGEMEALNTLESSRQRFVPVYDEKQDAIAYLVDVQRWKLAGRPHWSTLTVEPIFVPKTILLVEAWRQHLPAEDSAAVVVDEYGGFEGLLTREKFVEMLLSKAAPAPGNTIGIQPIGPDRYLVQGHTRLEEVERELGITLPPSESVDTVAGLVMNRFGYPPKPGEQLTLEQVIIKVKRTSRARILQLELQVLETTEEDEEEKGA